MSLSLGLGKHCFITTFSWASRIVSFLVIPRSILGESFYIFRICILFILFKFIFNIINILLCCVCCCCWVASVLSDSVTHRRQPTSLPCPWDSPGKNSGVGCHFLHQCMKVKREIKSLRRVQLVATPWAAACQAPPSMGFSRQESWSGVPLLSLILLWNIYICVCVCMCVCVCVCVWWSKFSVVKVTPMSISLSMWTLVKRCIRKCPWERNCWIVGSALPILFDGTQLLSAGCQDCSNRLFLISFRPHLIEDCLQ